MPLVPIQAYFFISLFPLLNPPGSDLPLCSSKGAQALLFSVEAPFPNQINFQMFLASRKLLTHTSVDTRVSGGTQKGTPQRLNSLRGGPGRVLMVMA